MRRSFAILGLGLLVLAVVLSVRAIQIRDSLPTATPAPEFSGDPNGVAERLGAALRIPTLSHQDPGDTEPATFRRLHQHLEQSFPRTHSALERTRVNELSLLYRWPGSDSALRPALLAAHLDVVPVDPTSERDWQHPPFSGRLVDGAIWGRGAIDDKSSLLAQLEAVESLLAEGFQPERTLYLAFGHDEEVGGDFGATAIAELLSQRGTPLAFVLDEGGVVSGDLMPGITQPLALIGIAEKGYVSVELTARVPGGHSSMPSPDSAVLALVSAVARLSENRPQARLVPSTRAMLEGIAPATSFPVRLILANLWLFEPLVLSLANLDPSADALVRTTTAPTILAAGVKENVIPPTARAVINFRILPGDSVASTLAHVQDSLDDPRVEAHIAGIAREPSKPSRIDVPAYALLSETIRKVFPNARVTPYLVAGGTDARHYRGLSESVYRFLPVRLAGDDRAQLHGTDEHIALDAHLDAVRFYTELIRDLQQLASP